MTKTFSISQKCSLHFFNYKGKIILYVGDKCLFDGISDGSKKFINLPLNGKYTLILDYIFEPEMKKFVNIDFPFSLPTIDYKVKKEPVLSFNGYNLSPASIYVPNAEIQVNRDFLNSPFYSQAFILWHEIGHLLYDGEFEADLYALKQAIENGISISMCVKTHFLTLTNTGENIERKEKLIYLYEKINELIKLN